ncbi:MAG: RimJ/RimL family protein N-acetyltransferase [Saprospiraceae bacterium]|jgi:RimJ/RimL family protein N-acetyltransferase
MKVMNNINPTEHLTFEPLSKKNYKNLYFLFKDDFDPFVQKEYKNIESAEKYFNSYSYFRDASPQTTVRDWFFKLKSTGEYIGLLNLYDLTFDAESEYHKMCSIGYATGEKYRRKGLTKEAMKALVRYIFAELNLECITASTTNENIASRAFLGSLGFSMNTKDHNDNLENKYFELWKSKMENKLIAS